MRQVWTHNPSGTAASLLRSPLADRPQIHQIVLPLSGLLPVVQVYLIEDQPLTLVDTGVRTPESRAVLEAALEELGYAFADIERVIVTHAHLDHMGLVQSIREAGANLECCVHEADAPMVEGFSDVVRERVIEMSVLFREYGVPEEIVARLLDQRLATLELDNVRCEATTVDRILREGDRLAWKDFSLAVRHSPGHTPGHILLEDEDLGLLFTGDQVMGQAVPNVENFYRSAMPEPGDPLRRRARFRGLVELRQSLRKLRRRPFQTLLPAYGGIIQRADRTIRDTLLFYDVRIQRIDRGLRHLAAMGQEVTAFEIWKALFPTNEALDEMRSHLLLLIGALDCLEDDGMLVTERRLDGVLTHHHR
jgi:glyoxylase-like metal-dependent hydrolase (beta-lactamase superfamily II)